MPSRFMTSCFEYASWALMTPYGDLDIRSCTPVVHHLWELGANAVVRVVLVAVLPSAAEARFRVIQGD